MRLLRLSLQNFRNYVRLDEETPGGVLLLVGANAQGKTNLLEAIYYLATFASFRARHDRDLVHFDAPGWGCPAVGRIVAEFQREGELRPRRLEVRLIREPNGNGDTQCRRLRREVLVDGMKKKLTEAIGLFNAVLFLPRMTELVTAAPEGRRRYLNMVLSQVYPAYAQALTAYQQALTRRNALLKTLQEQGGDPAQLDYWDAELARWGAPLIAWRAEALAQWELPIRESHWHLTRNAETLRLSYHPSFHPLLEGSLHTEVENNQVLVQAAEQIARAFHRALVRRREEAIARGITTVGPHRDDFRFRNNKKDLALYGSRGQMRTAVLALKMVEMQWMEKRTGRKPVLLLDEILAELDAERRANLQAHIVQSEQVWLTTTDVEGFAPDFVRQSTVWRLDAGVVSPVSAGGGQS